MPERPSRYALRKIDGPSSRGELLRHGAPTGVVINGAYIEQEFARGDQTLLLVTNDSPFEETLHCYLLDGHGSVSDHLELSGAYAPGTLRDVARAGDVVTFSFFGDERWLLVVHSTPRWTLPTLYGSPVRRTGGPFRRRWLSLTRR